MANVSNFVKSATMGTLRIILASGAFLDLDYDMGDLSITNLASKLNELAKFRRRGKRVSEAHGDRVDPAISFSAFATNWIGSNDTAPGSLVEALTGLGAYDGEDSTAGAARPFMVTLRFTVAGAKFGDDDDEVITCTLVYCTFGFAEAMDGNKFTISGECLGTVTVENGTNTVVFAEVG